MSAGTVSRVSKKTWTDEELMHIEHEGKVELVDGELVLYMPAGLEQEGIGTRLIIRLGAHVDKHDLGRVYGAQGGFRPFDNLRCPDVSFVRLDRLPDGKSPRGFGHFAPDLAVEILAPDESIRNYREKIEEYFSWGVRLVWIVDPNPKSVTVFSSPSDSALLTVSDVITGGVVIPGFSCPVADIFE